MKHKKVFEKVRKLIDERELDDANLESARDELFTIVESDAECDWAYGLLSEINYWLGEYAADADDKLAFYEEGVNCGKSGIEINADSLESNFWLSVNSGSFGQKKGIMQSLAMISPIKAAAEKALKLDENLFLRRTVARSPADFITKLRVFRFPSATRKKPPNVWKKPSKSGPKFFLNRLFLAEVYISNRDKAQAKKQLEWILNTPPNKNHEREDEDYKREARKIIKGFVK